MASELDDFDLQILALMRADARRTGEQLSEQVGLSAAACLRRVQRLRKIGAIEKEVAIIGPSYRRGGTVLIVLLTIDSHNPKAMDDFCNMLRRQEEVERLVWVTGDEDIVAILNCESMSDFADFAQVHFEGTPVEGYKTLVTMREYDVTGG